MKRATSEKLFAEANQYYSGRCDSPVRAWKAVGERLRFIQRAAGKAPSPMADATRTSDYVGSWGPMIVGHAHHLVMRALNEVDAQRHELRSAYAAPRSRWRGASAARCRRSNA